jgi:hypothetical protein
MDVETTLFDRRVGSSDEEDDVPGLTHSDSSSSGPDEMGNGKFSLLIGFASLFLSLELIIPWQNV